MQVKEIVGVLAGIMTATSLVPQFIKSVKEKKVSEFSPIPFLLLLAGNGLWVYYGTLLGDLPIICTNAFAVIMDIGMLILKWRYGNNR